MKCKECGKVHNTDNEYFCPECQEKCNKRNEFRELMNKLEGIANLDWENKRYMSGFSYAEMERFSLIMKKIVKKYNFPEEDKEFFNSHARKELTQLKETYFF